MKNTKFLILIAAILISLFAAMAAWGVLKPKQQMVVMTTQDIPANTLVKANMVKLQSVATNSAVPQALGDTNKVIDKVLIGPMTAGHQLSEKDILTINTSGEIANPVTPAIHTGHVAISVKVDSISGVTNNLKAGDRVNVQVGFKEGSGMPGMAGTLLQNRLVLDSQKSTDTDKKLTAVTIEVTPDEAVKVALIEAQDAAVRISLVPSGYKEIIIPGIKFSDVLGELQNGQ